MSRPTRLHLGIAIDGVGSHPAAWRDTPGGPDAPDAPDMLLDAAPYVARAQRAEAAGMDFVLLDDSYVVDPNRPRALQVRPDALLTMARVAPHTNSIGLVPSVNTNHTEPFHVAKNIATLDWISQGRAGWWPTVTTDDGEYPLFGRRSPQPLPRLVAEAADVVDVVGRLCDSWEDGAIIRDKATGRYLDRSKVHYVDFVGEFFKVRGPSITPRPPQGQPLVFIDAGGTTESWAARWADVAVISAPDPATAADRASALRTAAASAAGDGTEGNGRSARPVRVLARVEVLLGADDVDAARQARALDAFEPWGVGDTWRYVGGPAGLAAAMAQWAGAGVDGFLVLPARLPTDLDRFADHVMALLGTAGTAGHAADRAGGTTLRDRFGFTRPANRYAATT